MRIYSSRGVQSTLFEFTERKFTNKINSFLKYAPKYLAKFFKRKNKPSGVYVKYCWGYKTKEPALYYTGHIYPVFDQLFLSKLIKWAVLDMENKHDIFIDHSDPEGKQIYHLRSLEVFFVYT